MSCVVADFMMGVCLFVIFALILGALFAFCELGKGILAIVLSVSSASTFLCSATFVIPNISASPESVERLARWSTSTDDKIKMLIYDAVEDGEVSAKEYWKVERAVNNSDTYARMPANVIKEELLKNEKIAEYVELTTAKKLIGVE